MPRIVSSVLRCRAACALALALAGAACTSLDPRACSIGEQSAVHDSLYFGTAKAQGIVSPDEWVDFLKSTVTPRFPLGLTAWSASGQWRGTDGAIVREASHVVDLVHPDDAATEKAVIEIVAAYKSRFQQEAVLRVKSRACMSL